MKLSALLTCIVVVAFTMATTTATGHCKFTYDKDSGCDAEDVAEIVKLLNEALTGQLNKVGTRDLNKKDQDESWTGLRGAHEQGDRHLVCGYCEQRCGGNYGCEADCSWRYCRRDLQSSTAAKDGATFGQLIRNNLGTFEWNVCKPSNFKNMECTDV